MSIKIGQCICAFRYAEAVQLGMRMPQVCVEAKALCSHGKIRIVLYTDIFRPILRKTAPERENAILVRPGDQCRTCDIRKTGIGLLDVLNVHVPAQVAEHTIFLI